MTTKEILIHFNNWKKKHYIEQIGGRYAKRIDNVYKTYTELEIIDEYLKPKTK